MFMELNKKNNYKDFWSRDPLIQTPIFNKALSAKRFVNILRALHFFDNLQGYITNSVKKINKIKAVYDHLRAKFKESTRKLVIDESLILWRGNLSFRQYIHSKHHRFGLKLFCICDCKTGFVQDILIFTGKDTEVTSDRSLELSGAVVQTLMERYLDKNHALFFDNWYSSPKLFEFLLSRQRGDYVTEEAKKEYVSCYSSSRKRKRSPQASKEHSCCCLEGQT